MFSIYWWWMGKWIFWKIFLGSWWIWWFLDSWKGNWYLWDWVLFICLDLYFVWRILICFVIWLSFGWLSWKWCLMICRIIWIWWKKCWNLFVVMCWNDVLMILSFLISGKWRNKNWSWLMNVMKWVWLIGWILWLVMILSVLFIWKLLIYWWILCCIRKRNLSMM